jgi:hypothetical protein
MGLGRPKVALILTDDERMQLDSLAQSVADGAASRASRADHPRVRGAPGRVV